MSILSQLTSQVGERKEDANRKAARLCLEDPGLFNEIAEGLQSADAALAGDCAEVMTMAAEENPQCVAPYAPLLPKLLFHKNTRVRWEAAHALAYTGVHVPSLIGSILPLLSEIVRADKSVIVRDYVIDILGSYARVDTKTAGEAYPLLVEALAVWDGKHAGHALNGLANVLDKIPGRRAEVALLCDPYLEDKRGVVRKAAKKIKMKIGAFSIAPSWAAI
jgi:hypothetical protein